ncbi:MAG: DinB family protein [Acidobacteria bacterium]|nr:DinB family protein [Acidobacteriota bacterium]
MAMNAESLVRLLVERWEQVSRKIEALGRELPEETLERPTVNGVRPFGAVLRHVAFWNQYVADSLRGNTADDTANELAPGEYATKASILDALARSSQSVAAALLAHKSFDAKSAELVITFIEHTSEHYGQLVVYSRTLGIVPPASRA